MESPSIFFKGQKQTFKIKKHFLGIKTKTFSGSKKTLLSQNADLSSVWDCPGHQKKIFSDQKKKFGVVNLSDFEKASTVTGIAGPVPVVAFRSSNPLRVSKV